MADFGVKPDGSVDDRVRVVFGGTETRIFENYTVKVAVLQQPAAFNVRLGDAGTAKGILAEVPPNTPFQLKIGDVPQFTGFTDGHAASDGNGTSVTVNGRDVLAKLHDADIDKERSFVEVTYADIVTAALDDVGLHDSLLFYSNDASQIIRAGSDVVTKGIKGGAAAKQGTKSDFVDFSAGLALAAKNGSITALAAAALAASPTGGASTGVKHTVHAKLGERWLEFLHRHLEKAGLFLWADANGNIVLSSPNKEQKPSYVFVRQRGQLRNAVNVTGASLRNDTTRRVSECVVYARCGGRKSGRGKLHGSFVDEEMVAYGIQRRRTLRDVNVFDEQQAVKYARHKVAEMNRASWNLTYTVSGHTAPTGVPGQRAVIVPDTIATVIDDELGLSGNYYIEAVEYRAPPTTTTITMMRLQDLVWEKDPTIVEQVERANKGRKGRRRKRK